MNLLINLSLALFVLVSLVMVLVILMQRPKSEGLGAAFGGAVTDNIFGAQTTNVLVKFTTWLAGIFFALTFAFRRRRITCRHHDASYFPNLHSAVNSETVRLAFPTNPGDCGAGRLHFTSAVKSKPDRRVVKTRVRLVSAE